jgi:hypothetical protein
LSGRYRTQPVHPHFSLRSQGWRPDPYLGTKQFIDARDIAAIANREGVTQDLFALNIDMASAQGKSSF